MREIEKYGFSEVKAKTIKAAREPRLMTKHDTADTLPKPLKDEGLNVLSISRSAYLVGQFEVFERFPDVSLGRPEFCELPDLETLDVEHITSESNATHALIISGALNKFLDASDAIETFNGRMGTGDFDFVIKRRSGGRISVPVRSAQLEIDAGLENEDSVIIVEAKNVVHADFNVRQLYYPYRKYHELVKKPIRLVFSQYDNLTYKLFEYEFEDLEDFNSIRYVRGASYTFEDDSITMDDISLVWRETTVLYDDHEHVIDGNPPFPQADRIDRIFTLMEFLSTRPEGATAGDMAEHMEVVERQALYYPAAGAYLGVFDRAYDRERHRKVTTLSAAGTALLRKNRRGRLLDIVAAMFRHEVFHRLYRDAVECGELPSLRRIMDVMDELHVLDDNKDSTHYRRAQTVGAWLRWIFELPDDE